MKKLYEEPFLEITKFSFEDMLSTNYSKGEDDLSRPGGEVVDPFADDSDEG
jgi:hypothetical protein